MKSIESVVVIGMGALGLLFGQRIRQSVGGKNFCFMMDDKRAQIHKNDVYTINGAEVNFPIYSLSEYLAEGKAAPDLIIVATKYSGLYSARSMIREIASVDTTVISLLNGITSEEILKEIIPGKQIIDCIALGMDAVRDGTNLTYKNMGRLRIGVPKGDEGNDEKYKARLIALSDFFDEVDLPYEVREDITHDMWNKLMMNVGINQTCMVYEATYGEALHKSPAKDDLKSAMYEVIKIANLEGINLTEEDYNWNISVFETLNPDGMPSMRQDALAKRPSEVELFAGTMIRYAQKHGVSVPINEKYYKIIKEMESKY